MFTKLFGLTAMGSAGVAFAMLAQGPNEAPAGAAALGVMLLGLLGFGVCRMFSRA